MLSFRNLVELHVLNAIRRRHRISLFKVRYAIAILAEAWSSEHPLAERDVLTDGYHLFARVTELITNVTRKEDQLYLEAILIAALQRVERHPVRRGNCSPFPRR